MKRAGSCGGILKRAGVGGNGGEQQIGNRLGDRPACDFEQTVNQFAATRFAPGNPVDVGVARIAFVMVNVDEHLPVADALAGFAEPFVARAIGRDNAVEIHPAFRFLKNAVRVEEF